jgi:hypothetical protein
VTYEYNGMGITQFTSGTMADRAAASGSTSNGSGTVLKYFSPMMTSRTTEASPQKSSISVVLPLTITALEPVPPGGMVEIPENSRASLRAWADKALYSAAQKNILTAFKNLKPAFWYFPAISYADYINSIRVANELWKDAVKPEDLVSGAANKALARENARHFMNWWKKCHPTTWARWYLWAEADTNKKGKVPRGFYSWALSNYLNKSGKPCPGTAFLDSQVGGSFLRRAGGVYVLAKDLLAEQERKNRGRRQRNQEKIASGEVSAAEQRASQAEERAAEAWREVESAQGDAEQARREKESAQGDAEQARREAEEANQNVLDLQSQMDAQKDQLDQALAALAAASSQSGQSSNGASDDTLAAVSAQVAALQDQIRLSNQALQEAQETAAEAEDRAADAESESGGGEDFLGRYKWHLTIGGFAAVGALWYYFSKYKPAHAAAPAAVAPTANPDEEPVYDVRGRMIGTFWQSAVPGRWVARSSIMQRPLFSAESPERAVEWIEDVADRVR